jgi:hypothetical protein
MQGRGRRTAAAAALGVALFAPVLRAAEVEPSAECFTVAQTREKIAEHRLADPFPLMRRISSERNGEPLSARLCRRAGVFVYDVSILRRDGRIVRVPIDAASGGAHPAAHGAHP